MRLRKKITISLAACATLLLTAALYVLVPSAHERTAMQKVEWAVQNAQQLRAMTAGDQHPTYFIPQVNETIPLSNGETRVHYELARLTFTQDEWGALKRRMRVSARIEDMPRWLHFSALPCQPWPQIHMAGRQDGFDVWIGIDPTDGHNLWIDFSATERTPLAMEINFGKGA